MKLNLLLTFNEFFQQYGLIIAFTLAGIVFAIVIVFFIIAMANKKKTGPVVQTVSIEKEKILEAIGGKDNIISKTLVGSRIALVLKDYSLVNEEMLKVLGVDSIVKMSNKITLVIKGDSSSFYKAFN